MENDSDNMDSDPPSQKRLNEYILNRNNRYVFTRDIYKYYKLPTKKEGNVNR